MTNAKLPKKRRIVLPPKRKDSVAISIHMLTGTPLAWAFHAVRRGRIIAKPADLVLLPSDLESVLVDYGLRYEHARTAWGTGYYAWTCFFYKERSWAPTLVEALAKHYLKVVALCTNRDEIEIPKFILDLEAETPSD